MKKFILPVAVVLMAAGAAFATNVAKSGNKSLVDAYRIDAITGDCIRVQQQCETTPGLTCTWSVDGSTPLHQLNPSETMCGDELFKAN